MTVRTYLPKKSMAAAPCLSIRQQFANYFYPMAPIPVRNLAFVVGMVKVVLAAATRDFGTNLLLNAVSDCKKHFFLPIKLQSQIGQKKWIGVHLVDYHDH